MFSSYWLRQLSDTAEKSYPGIAQTMIQYGKGNTLTPKVMDGTTWVGLYDETPNPITGYGGLIQFRDMMKPICKVIPVVVPRGSNWSEEAGNHATIAKAFSALIVDLEPYTGFWDRGSTRNIPNYAQYLRTNAPNTQLIIQPDPRTYGLSAIFYDSIIPYFDGVMAQHYVGWNEAQWLDVEAEVQSFHNLKQRSPNKLMGITLWGLGNLEAAGAFYTKVKPEINLGVNVFTLGNMNQTQLEYFGNLFGIVSPDRTKEYELRIGLGSLFSEAASLVLDTENHLSETLPNVYSVMKKGISIIDEAGK